MSFALTSLALLFFFGSTKGCVSVVAHGAKGDGVFDDTSAFIAAVEEAAPTGGCISVPGVKAGGGYVITNTVALAPGVKLIGEPAGFPVIPWVYGPPGDVNSTGGARIFARPGTDAIATHAPLFTLTRGCAVRGLLIIYDLMPYPSGNSNVKKVDVYKNTAVHCMHGQSVQTGYFRCKHACR